MSLYDRIISRPRPVWVNILVGLLLLLAPVAAVALDGAWDEFREWDKWRALMAAPVILLYALAAPRWLSASDTRMLAAFRPVVQIDDEAFERTVRGASRTTLLGEIIALCLGVLAGLGISLAWIEGLDAFWLRLYIPVSLAMMDGLLAWTVYGLLTGTSLLAALHRQPLKVDILDIRPFEPVGRYSLTLSLVFAGGVVLAMVFGLNADNIHAWQTWLIYLPVMSVPFIIFFLNMRGTHRLLAAEKRRGLKIVADKIRATSTAIRVRLEGNESLGELAGEYAALVAYEARLRIISTWPYNTSMLRTLFFSILVPLLVRGISALLFEQ